MADYPVRMAEPGELPALVAYLQDQLRDNGAPGQVLFQPLPRGTAWSPADRLAEFHQASQLPIGQPVWRRFWLARAGDGTIAGHVDLRGDFHPSASHRAVLGMGVHRDHRRRGLGRLLVDTVVKWATDQSSLHWIDLQVLAGNDAAHTLYQQTGFRHVGTVRDKFRIDGMSVDEILMTLYLR